jgi:uncharacterized protein involved in exopolysaccharide biosynthesis
VHEFYAQFLHLLNAVWHRRWAALGATWLVALLGWALVVAQPNTYTSSARIFIDATSIMKPVLEGLAIDWDLNLDPEVMKQTLTTRANLERVARMTDLDLTATTPAAMERLVNNMRSRTTFENEGRYLLRLSFTDADPARAQQVAQALTGMSSSMPISGTAASRWRVRRSSSSDRSPTTRASWRTPSNVSPLSDKSA